MIDPQATGRNILRLRQSRGLSVKDIQNYFGFEEPQAIYKWQRGMTLPSVDNLVALSILLEVRMDEIIVLTDNRINFVYGEPQDENCGSVFLCRFREIA